MGKVQPVALSPQPRQAGGDGPCFAYRLPREIGGQPSGRCVCGLRPLAHLVEPTLSYAPALRTGAGLGLDVSVTSVQLFRHPTARCFGKGHEVGGELWWGLGGCRHRRLGP